MLCKLSRKLFCFLVSFLLLLGPAIYAETVEQDSSKEKTASLQEEYQNLQTAWDKLKLELQEQSKDLELSSEELKQYKTELERYNILLGQSMEQLQALEQSLQDYQTQIEKSQKEKQFYLKVSIVTGSSAVILFMLLLLK
jgi:multidrug resistance efflux pump